MTLHPPVALLLALIPLLPCAQRSAPSFPEPVTRTLEGFTVHVDARLLGERRELGAAALRLLELKLYELERAVPAPALAKLRDVPIWIGVEDEHGRHPCACYHPSREWLVEHGYDPRKARCVDIANAATFLEWTRAQPAMVLHELAHAYHDRVLGRERPELLEAWRRAVEGGRYESVLHADGARRRHYALNDEQELFAEASEAFFGTNDFYPFVRAELREHDPELAALVERLWKLE